MSDATSGPDRRALLATALHKLEEMQSRLDAAERVQKEPIAIVGLGCRFPGADTPDQFWRCSGDGVDAIARGSRPSAGTSTPTTIRSPESPERCTYATGRLPRSTSTSSTRSSSGSRPRSGDWIRSSACCSK